MTDAWEDRRDELRDKYRFYIMNPARSGGVNYSLWIREDGYEYPVLQSNTGGFVTFNSRHETIGDGIKPTDEFLDLVGIGFHEAMCFMPPVYFSEEFEETFTSIYDGKPREYEVWAAQVLIDWMCSNQELIPELEPLVRWAGDHTEFGVPVLGDSDD